MKLQAIEINRRFVPTWNGNKDLAANEQVVIHFVRIPGTSEKSNYVSWGAKQDGTFGLNYNDNQLLAAFVERVENLEIGNNKIKKGADLATASHPKLTDLITEIRQYLFPEDEELTEGESEA